MKAKTINLSIQTVFPKLVYLFEECLLFNTGGKEEMLSTHTSYWGLFPATKKKEDDRHSQTHNHYKGIYFALSIG